MAGREKDADEAGRRREIPFGRPRLDAAELEAAARVLSGNVLVHGPVTREFERRFAERVGARFAVSVSSCTAAMHLALLCRGVGPGDRVAVPAMTHVATAHAVEFCGAAPVFVDVEADSGNVDPAALEAVADRGLQAAMVVHYLGLPCDMDRIAAIAARAGAFVVEDCALAADASYDGHKAGTLGLAGCFSFYPIKHMTSIEGGMVTTDDEALAAAVAERRAFGYDRPQGKRAQPGVYDVVSLGYNYRMNEVEAAVGLAQMDKLDAHQAMRRRNFSILKACLDEVDEVTVFAAVRGKAVSSHYCLNAVLPRDGSIDRAAVAAALAAAGVGTSVHYPRAVPLMSYYRNKYGYREGQFPIAEWLAAQTISLPVGPHVSEQDAHYIGRKFKESIQASRAHGRSNTRVS